MSNHMGLLFLVALASPAHGLVTSSSVTPVEKVISMMEKMQAQTEQEGKDEAKQYDKYACFCKEEADKKQYAKEQATKKIDKLTRLAASLTAEKEATSADLAQQTKDIKAKKDEIEAITEKRDGQHERYMQNMHDDKAMLHDLDDGIKNVKAASSHMEDGEVILNLMKHVRGEVMDELNYHEEKEFNQTAEFDSKKLALTQEIKFLGEAKVESEETYAQLDAKLQDTETSKDDQTKERAAAQDVLTTLTADCEAKAADYDKRSKTRTDELSALAQAIDIMKEGAQDNYAANKKLVLAQKTKVARHGAASHAPAFLQEALSADSSSAAPVLRKFLSQLQGSAKKLSSPALAFLVMKVQVAAKHDNFVKVRAMIKDMISNLAAEAQAEEDEKGFCDRELGRAISSRDGLNREIESALASISELKASLASDTTLISQLTKDVAEAKISLAEATTARQESKKENERVVSDSKEGLAAVQKAHGVLEQFYLGAAESDSSYQGNQGASTGILGLLQVIQDDFSRTIGETEAGESTEESEFQTLKSEFEEEISLKEADTMSAEGRVNDNKVELSNTETSLAENEDMLATTKEMLAQLKKRCIDDSESYEERVAKRKQEIEALKDAYKILDEWDA